MAQHDSFHPRDPGSRAALSTPPTSPRCALLSGGGSGGHVFPALAIAAELLARGWSVSWVGSEHGLEARLVEQQGIPFHALAARPVVGQGWLARLRAAATLLRSAVGARGIVRRLDARVVVGTGGYASVPAVIGGRLAARPVLLFEPNAVGGAANRWLSVLAREAALAYQSAAADFRCPTHITGIPVRKEFFDVPEPVPGPGPLRLLVLGGSQGARQLNELLPAALALLGKALPDLIVCHQVGERLLDEARLAYDRASLGGIQVELVPFLDDVASAMARSHLVLSRAGAITLAELCAAGRPALLVPLAIAGAHQLSNAQRLAEEGASVVLESAQASAERLSSLLAELLGDPVRLQSMGRSARRLNRRDATARIVDRLELLGGGSR